MTQLVTVRGFVATDTELRNYEGGLSVTGFRLASTERRYDRTTGQWYDGPTNWFSVSCFRDLAVNVVASIKKGDPVLVSGRLQVKTFERPDKSTGTSVDILAESVGHDLGLGTAVFSRRAHAPRAESPAAEGMTPFAGPASAGTGDGAEQPSADREPGGEVIEDEGTGERVDADTGEMLGEDAA